MKRDKATDEKKDFKRQRIRTYFLEAAKEIIIREGYESVSARKVADIAGYSYATIYNYFADINELMWEVKEAMIKDMFEAFRGKMDQTVYDIEGVKKGFRLYISYYFENPNVFKFFNFYPLIKPTKRTEAADSGPDFDGMWKETLKSSISEGKLQEKDIEVVANIFIYSIHGMITLCFSNNGDLKEEGVYGNMERMVDYLL